MLAEGVELGNQRSLVLMEIQVERELVVDQVGVVDHNSTMGNQTAYQAVVVPCRVFVPMGELQVAAMAVVVYYQVMKYCLAMVVQFSR